MCLTSGDERVEAESWSLGEALLHAACGEDAAVVEGARKMGVDAAGGSRVISSNVDNVQRELLGVLVAARDRVEL